MSNNNQPYPAERNCTYTIPYNQLSLADIFSDCQDIYDSVKPRFLSLLQQHIDLEEIVPASFRKRFYASTSRSRKYSLYAFLRALIIQRFFLFQRIRYFLSFFTTPGISRSSVALTRFRMLSRSLVSNRSIYMNLISGRNTPAFAKDVVYRFMKMVQINWSRFTTVLSGRIINEAFVPLGS